MSNFLKYGDLVIFYYAAKHDMINKVSQHTDGSSNQGLLTALGYIDSGLYFQEKPGFGNSDDPDTLGDGNFPAFKEAVFKITPRLSSDAHNDYRALMDKLANVEFAINTCPDDKQDELEKLTVMKKQLLSREEKLRTRYTKEQSLNLNIIEDCLGTVVRYGSEIQLMHFDSQSFVTATSDASQTDKVGYSCYLDSWYDPGMIFMLLPRFKSRQEGDTIQIRDQVLLKNLRNEAFISFDSSTAQLMHDDRYFGPSENPFLIDNQIVDTRTSRYTAYLSQEPQNSYQVILYSVFRDIDSDFDALSGGDIVRITHTEVEATLAADISYTGNGLPEVYLRKYEGPFAEELNSASSLWVAEHERFDYAGRNFFVGKYEPTKSIGRQIRLRHLLTNKLLTSGLESGQTANPLVLCKSLEESYDALKLEFEPVIKNTQVVVNNQIVFIRDCDSGAYIRQAKGEFIKLDMDKLKSKLSRADIKNDFSPLNEQDLSETRWKVAMNKDFSSEDAYRIHRVTKEERNDCLYVKSSLPLLKFLATELKKPPTDLNRDLLLKTKQSMENLICFLFDKTFSPSIDLFDIEDDPITKRQKLLREFGVISILVTIAYRSLRYSQREIDQYFEMSPDLRLVLRLIFSTLRYAIKEYRPNELFLSQWMSMITELSIKTQGNTDVYAGKTLIELIDNNRRILETRIQRNTLQLFIKFLLHKKDDHFVEILRVICICDKDPMLKNQKEITELMLKKEEVRDKLLFILVTDQLDGVLFTLTDAHIERIPLKELQYKVIEVKGNEKVFKYVVAMTRLLADLCKDRNYLAIDILKPLFPVEVCFAIICETEYPNELRDAFVCLTISLWIDISPLHKLELPIRIKFWHETKTNKQFKMPILNQAVFGKIDPRPFIIKYLNEMKRETVQEIRFMEDPRQSLSMNTEARWSLDLAVLTMAEKMLKLGIISEDNYIKQIVLSLKSYLRHEKNKRAKNIDGVNMLSRANSSIMPMFSRRATHQREHIQEIISKKMVAPTLIVECKKKICDILSFVVLLSNEIVIKDYLYGFKAIMQSVDPQIVYFLDDLVNLKDKPEDDKADEKDEKDAKDELNQNQTNELALMSSLPRNVLEGYLHQLIREIDSVTGAIVGKPNPLNLDIDDSMVAVILELLIYNDIELKEAALNLLNMLFTQRKEVGNIIFDLQIIEDEVANDHYNKAKDYCSSINSIGDSIEKCYENSECEEMMRLGGVLNNIYKSLLSIQHRGSIDMSQADRANPDRAKGLLNENNSDSKGQLQSPFSGSRAVRNKTSHLAVKMQQKHATRYEEFKGRRVHITPTFLELKNQINLTDIHQYHIDSDMEKIDPFEQDLFRNSGIYKGLIKILKFDIEVANCNRGPALVHLLRKIYRILAKSSKDSFSNKHYLANFLDKIILQHFQENNTDLNACFLVKEMIIDNKLVLLDEVKVKAISKLVCSINEKLPSLEIRRSYNLCILKSMVRYKDLVLDNNQNYILDEIISKKYSSLQVIFSQAQMEKGVLSLAINDKIFETFTKLGNKDVIILPPELCYAISYLELLTSCAENRNTFSETICQSILPMDTLKLLLANKNLSLVMKKPLVSFFYNVYLAHDREVPLHAIETFLDIAISLSNEFGFYALKAYQHLTDLVDLDFLMVLSNESYNLLPFIIENYLLSLTDCFINIVNRDLKLVKSSSPHEKFMTVQYNLIDFIKDGSTKIGSKTLEKKFHLLLESIYKKNRNDPDIIYLCELILKPNKKNEGDVFEQKLIVRRAYKRTSKLGRDGYFQKIETLIDFYFSGEEFNDICRHDFYDLIMKLQSIERITENHTVTLTLERLFANVTRLIYSLTDKKHSHGRRNTLVTAIILFRKYVQMDASANDRDIPDLFKDDYWADNQPAIQARQDKLGDLGMVDIVCTVIKSSNDPIVCQEAILLGIVLLWGGNTRIQNLFLEIFEKEEFQETLHKIKDLVRTSFSIVQKNMTELNTETKRRFKLKKHIQKTQMKPDLEEGVYLEIKEKQPDKEAETVLREIRNEVEALDLNHSLCKCIFQFLQLLCEGHNLKMQNYIRSQNTGPYITSDSNFIAITASLWGSFIKFVNPSCVNLGILILNFLVESIQGPCGGNQLELYKNKMIEYCKDFMNDFLSLKDYELRGFDKLTSSLLDSLILRSIKSLDAMLEANPHEEMYYRMGNHIDLHYIMRRLAKIFISYQETAQVDESATVNTADLTYSSKTLSKKTFDSRLSEVFQIFFFLKIVNDKTKQYEQAIQELRGQDAYVFAFMDYHSAHIEIVFNDLLQKHYFVVHPACRYLSTDEKVTFLNNADRETPLRKITSFIQQAPRFFDQIDQMAALRGSCLLVSDNLFWFLRKLCLMIVLSMNIYMFLYLEKRVQQNQNTIIDDYFGQVYLKLHGAIHLVLSLAMLIVWCILNCKLILIDGWRSVFNRARRITLAQEETPLNKIERKEVLYILEKNAIDVTKEDSLLIMKYAARQTLRSLQFIQIEYYTHNTIFLFSSSTLVFLTFYLTLSAIAFISGMQIMYAIHLYDVIVGFFDTEHV